MQKAHNTYIQLWLYLDNNGTMTYKMIIQHKMHTTSTNNITINNTISEPGLPHPSRPSWELSLRLSLAPQEVPHVLSG